ncbi:hypothetical protein MKW94_006476 [Papaver nudicaule]|uniref:Neprosin PEP catalytic domain-containing protein n=1 Tax=Papaver nudicaule TaxID=74823 RepID=A0AA41SFG6_PAPNU|nr:hypothetical protein [Papaver nudicaule]
MSKLLTFLLLALHCLININYHHSGSVVGKVISKEEENDIDEQLKILHKPPIKTFETKGVNVDCIDINKQPAFDHPLLKSHVVQLRPSSRPKDPSSKSSSWSSSRLQQPWENVNLGSYACPEGTVPLRRTIKEDLIRAKPISKSLYSTTSIFQTAAPNPESYVQHVAYRHSFNVTNNITRPLVIHGIQADIKIDNPPVQNDQLSASLLLAEGGPKDTFSTILAGWMVAPTLYGDNYTHLSIFWRNGTTNGCFNMLCPGFVQVDSSVPIGEVFPVKSEYGTRGYSFTGLIFQDVNSLNWWFTVIANNVTIDIGYWPREIIPFLTNTANYVAWGGFVRTPPNTPSPPMGNGHFPEGDINKVSAMVNTMYVDEKYTLQVPRNVYDWENFSDNTDCYGIDFVEDHPDLGKIIFFGGPGGNC